MTTFKMPEPVAWHNHPDFPSIKWSDLELRFIEQRDAQWKDALRDVLEQAAMVCEAMHDEDRPGDYAYAIRAMKEAVK